MVKHVVKSHFRPHFLRSQGRKVLEPQRFFGSGIFPRTSARSAPKPGALPTGPHPEMYVFVLSGIMPYNRFAALGGRQQNGVPQRQPSNRATSGSQTIPWGRDDYTRQSEKMQLISLSAFWVEWGFGYSTTGREVFQAAGCQLSDPVIE